MIRNIFKKYIAVWVIFLFFIKLYGEKVYTGTAVPVLRTEIKAGTGADFWGYLTSSAKFGEITRPDITNLKGKVKIHGTELIQMRRDYWGGKVEEAKGKLIKAKKNLDTAYKEFKRYKKLSPTGAVPMKKFQKKKAKLYEALGQYRDAVAMLNENNEILQQCRESAPFEGIVDKVYYTRGLLVSDPEVLQITQLNPIGIKVSMSDKEAAEISAYTAVTITGRKLNEPVGVFNGYSYKVKDGIVFLVRNSPNLYIDKKVEEVSEVFYVTDFYINPLKPNALGVAAPAINKDNKGYYVWKAKDNKVMQPGKGIDPVFKIEKTYIVPGKLERLYNGITEMRILDKPGKLELHDILVVDVNAELQDGQTVTLPANRYKLMPGDKVKVVIKN
ncbi:MAG: hypothetical protein K9L78_03910 [Victivallales bacterium]|nr:hypothetical protein [Victivallales bacterium]MCF7889246.1 hypothetical protein [Victivallales bacterium]